jgi:hypothetical protein
MGEVVIALWGGMEEIAVPRRGTFHRFDVRGPSRSWRHGRDGGHDLRASHDRVVGVVGGGCWVRGPTVERGVVHLGGVVEVASIPKTDAIWCSRGPSIHLAVDRDHPWVRPVGAHRDSSLVVTISRTLREWCHSSPRWCLVGVRVGVVESVLLLELLLLDSLSLQLLLLAISFSLQERDRQGLTKSAVKTFFLSSSARW